MSGYRNSKWYWKITYYPADSSFGESAYFIRTKMADTISKIHRRDAIKSIVIILPSVILIGIFIYGFIGNTIYTSLTDWGKNAGLAFNPVKNFIGLGNYKNLFTGFIQSRFRQDLVNTIFYSLFLLGGTLVLGLFLAILLDRSVAKEGVFRTIFLYPMALSFIVTGTIWRWLLAPDGGVNLIPTVLGLKKSHFLWISSRGIILPFNWQNIPTIIFVPIAILALFLLIRNIKKSHTGKTVLYSVIIFVSLLYIFVLRNILPPILPFKEIHGFKLATIGILIAAVWQYSGYTMALYLAGLRGLPESMKEAAKLDGATEFKYYWHIAIPNVKPITLSAVIILAHISLKLFDLIYALAGADNINTGHPSIDMYLTTFRANQFASGAAMAVILFILAALFIIPYMVHTHRERKVS